MFSKKVRDEAYVARLRAFIEESYALRIDEFTPGQRGWYGETWVGRTDRGKLFFKLIADDVQAARYRASFAVVEHMRECGIDFISRPIRSRRGESYLLFEGGTLGAFAFVEGEHTEDYPLEDLMALLAKTYSLPAKGLAIPTEVFSSHEAECMQAYVDELRRVEKDNAQAREALRVVGSAGELIARQKSRLCAVSAACARDMNGFVLTSGDVGGNVIIHEGQMTIIDWDDMRIAPPERDLWFYMQMPDQLDLIERSLATNGFQYALKPERLAFYCYSRWFFYICEYARCILAGGEMAAEALDQLSQYLREDHFVSACVRVADGICIK